MRSQDNELVCRGSAASVGTASLEVSDTPIEMARKQLAGQRCIPSAEG